MTPSVHAELMVAFFEESLEGVERAEAGLLSMSLKGADSETTNDVFRAIHSLKGAAGSFGHPGLGELAHGMESMLDRMRKGELQCDDPHLRLLLECVDALRSEVIAVRDGSTVNDPLKRTLITRLENISATPGTASPETAQASSSNEAAWRVTVAPSRDILKTGNDPTRLIRALRELGASEVKVDVSALPMLSTLDPLQSYLSWELRLDGSVKRAEIDEVFAWVEGDCVVTIERQSPSAPQAGVKRVAEPTPSATASAEKSSIRVGIDKIDALMNLVGELVITQSMLGELDDDRPLSPARMARIREGLGQLAGNTRLLQERVMRLRSMPIGVLFNRFTRLVHDLSGQFGKQISLVVEGEQNELDKTVLEKLSDPMVHLLRNAIDHGIELPASRIAAGKSPNATITLRARNKGADMLVEVSDDGCGIDLEKVRAKAIDRGLITKDAALSDDEIRSLIFEPGFSTAEKVSDVSGRGVGMDVVRQNVKQLGGAITLSSQKGIGTTVTLRLPLSMAIIDGQLIRVGEVTCVVPLLSIVESTLFEAKNAKKIVGQRAMYRFRDELMPLVNVSTLLGFHSAAEPPQVVVVESDQGRLALRVDELLGQQQVVVKSLEATYGRVEGLQGATILGDGDVAYIIEITGLARLSQSFGQPVDATSPHRPLEVA